MIIEIYSNYDCTNSEQIAYNGSRKSDGGKSEGCLVVGVRMEKWEMYDKNDIVC